MIFSDKGPSSGFYNGFTSHPGSTNCCGHERELARGFTLLEGLVVFFVATIVMGFLLMILSSTRRGWYSADARVCLQQELRKAMLQIENDLSESSETQISCSPGTNCTSLSFNVSKGVLASGSINWSANPVNYTLTSGQVIRAEGPDSRVVANNISGMVFSRQAGLSRIVQINLSAQKNDQFDRVVSENLSSSIMMRN